MSLQPGRFEYLERELHAIDDSKKKGDEGLELLPFSSGSMAICIERDAESDAYLHEKAVIEPFRHLQPLLSTELKESLIAELVVSLVEG